MGAPVSYKRGVSDNIESVNKVDGQLLFTTDQGHIYLDNGTNNRIELYAKDLKTFTDAIALLNGTADTGGSVANKVATAKTELIGTNTDTKDANTIYGAKAYTKEVQDSLKTVATSGKAADVTVADEGNNFTNANVETVLAELATKVGTNAVTLESSGGAQEGDPKVYTLKQGGAVVGTIDIPKDMVVKNGSIVSSDGITSGTFIKLVLSNDQELYIDVRKLVDQVTGGSSDMITVSVDTNSETNTTNEITATIIDNSITKTKLDSGVKTSLGLADTALQPSNVAVTVEKDKYIAGITVGGENKITYVTKPFSEISALQWGDFSTAAGS